MKAAFIIYTKNGEIYLPPFSNPDVEILLPGTTVKFLNFRTLTNFTVSTLKLKLRGSTMV